MADIEASPAPPAASDGMVTLTHVIYGLHAFSAVTGIVAQAFIVTAFLTGWPSILAVILNYVKRSDVQGRTWRPTLPGRFARSGTRCCGRQSRSSSC